MIEIRRIDSETARTVRHPVLRPDGPYHEAIFPLDDHPDSFHAGAFEGIKLVGVSTLLHEDIDGTLMNGMWRVRGMGVLPDYQGRGIGRLLLLECIAHARRSHGKGVWCNGRVSAAAFYLGSGFQIEGKEFELPTTGPHYLLKLAF